MWKGGLCMSPECELWLLCTPGLLLGRGRDDEGGGGGIISASTSSSSSSSSAFTFLLFAASLALALASCIHIGKRLQIYDDTLKNCHT